MTPAQSSESGSNAQNFDNLAPLLLNPCNTPFRDNSTPPRAISPAPAPRSAPTRTPPHTNALNPPPSSSAHTRGSTGGGVWHALCNQHTHAPHTPAHVTRSTPSSDGQ